MQRWFGETFDIIFSAMDQQQLANPWSRSSQIIASIDYAKQVDVRERVWQQHWDLVIIDEAHKCSAHTKSGGAGRGPQVDATKRYELAAKLSSQTDHVLLIRGRSLQPAGEAASRAETAPSPERASCHRTRSGE